MQVWWLLVTVTAAVITAEPNFMMPGVRDRAIPVRSESAIIFPGAAGRHPSLPAPRPPSGGSGRFTPRRPPPPAPESPEPKPVDDPDSILDLPDELDLNKLTKESLMRLNSIDNITDFASLFDIALPTPELGDLSRPDLEIAVRFGDSGGSGELATMATCRPELQTVSLDLPVEQNTIFYPTCVRIEQCGGCCYGPLLACQPTVTEKVTLKVLKTVANSRSSSSSGSSRRQGGRRRRRRQNTSSYENVDVLKHVQCACGCKVQEQHCNPAIHNYEERECACVCKSRDEKAKCEEQNQTKYWDNESCACYCLKSLPCGTGEFFDQATCRCEVLSARAGFFPNTDEEVLDRRQRNGRPSRRRPIRIPVNRSSPRFSSRPTLLNMLHTTHRPLVFTP